jgi:hypothetical protein
MSSTEPFMVHSAACSMHTEQRTVPMCLALVAALDRLSAVGKMTQLTASALLCIWQGPHHCAYQSTRTGTVVPEMSSSKLPNCCLLACVWTERALAAALLTADALHLVVTCKARPQFFAYTPAEVRVWSTMCVTCFALLNSL